MILDCQKVYHNPKTDSKGKKYDLINIISDGKKYTIFDYLDEYAGLKQGDTFDISNFVKKEQVYEGKTSYLLTKPKKTDILEERVTELERRLEKMLEWAKTIEKRLLN